MKISTSWLREYVDHPYDVGALADALTMSGLEVEEIIQTGINLDGIVVGQVLDVQPHPDADKLRVCQVTIGGDEPLSIVCGASNVAVHQQVAVATIGSTVVVTDKSGEPVQLKIKKSKLRGVPSHGMICAEDELGLGKDHTGILVLESDAAVGEPLADYLDRRKHPSRDHVLDIAITPNRPDAISHIGVARDVATLASANLKRPRLSGASTGKDLDEMISVAIDSPEACYRYVAMAVTDVTIGPSPDWIQARLTSVGLRPINNVVDVTNYVMYECGQPLHAFDYDLIRGKEIRVKTTETTKTFVTLDGKEHKLSVGAPMICDGEGEIAIAGIMGGANSEVSDSTTTVLLESAYFDPSLTRRFAKELDIQTDASYRFERGVDTEGQAWAARRAAELIAEIGGGKLVPGIVDVRIPQPEREPVRMRVSRVARITGVPIAKEEIVRLLSGIGFDITEQGDELFCKVPSFRPDVSREIDLIEEVIRLHGFDKIPEPASVSIPSLPPDSSVDKRDQIRSLLSGCGFMEIVTNSLLSSEDASVYNDRAMFGDEMFGDVVDTANAINRGMTTLRPCLLARAVSAVAFNFNHGQKGVRFFELGHVFRKGQHRNSLIPGYIEHESLLICLAGERPEAAWDRSANPFDLFDVKGIADRIFEKLGIAAEYSQHPVPATIANPAISIALGGRHAGLAGVLNPKLLAAANLKAPVFFAELNLSLLLEKAPSGVTKYTSVSRFPTVERDLAVVVESATPASAAESAIRNAGGKLLADVRLFDVYAGKGVVDGRKSLAFGLTYAANRTLRDAEVDKSIKKIIAALEQQFGAELRQ